jgi:hypothetical protein
MANNSNVRRVRNRVRETIKDLEEELLNEALRVMSEEADCCRIRHSGTHEEFLERRRERHRERYRDDPEYREQFLERQRELKKKIRAGFCRVSGCVRPLVNAKVCSYHHDKETKARLKRELRILETQAEAVIASGPITIQGGYDETKRTQGTTPGSQHGDGFAYRFGESNRGEAS